MNLHVCVNIAPITGSMLAPIVAIILTFVNVRHLTLQNDVFYKSPKKNWGTTVHSLSSSLFTERWIGRGGAIPCPPRLPDVKSLDIFIFWDL